MLKPRLNTYDLNALVCLWNLAKDDFSRNKIKIAIVEKILFINSSMFYLINKFLTCKTDVLKECYADAILMNMKDNDYFIREDIVIEILKYASLDVLIYYGADSLSYEFNIKCRDEFWKRALEIENKIELKRKQDLDKKLVLKLGKKGDSNDKY